MKTFIANWHRRSVAGRNHVPQQSRLIRTILVPTDFSECSLAGFDYAVRLANDIGAQIIVVHVADLGPVMMTSGDYDSPSYTAAARCRSEDEMQAFLQSARGGGVPVKTLAVAGYCPDAIYDVAAKEHADLIVIATHGRSGLRHAFAGSVAEATVRHAPCPVIVVPPSCAYR